MNFKSQLCAAILTLGCSCLSANAMVANDAAKENKAQHYQPSAENLESRKQFQDDKFGIFLHWGLYSMLATGEWTSGKVVQLTNCQWAGPADANGVAELRILTMNNA